MSYKVDVTGISPSTSQTELSDFFSFCGKIASIDYAEKSGKATVNFEKASAAKTALMLNGGTLDGSTLTVTSDAPVQDEPHHDDPSAPPEQHDKPRAAIAAEYLAKGYQLSDQVLQRAIEIDHNKGISQKFLSYVQDLDKTAGARALGPEQTISAKLQETFDQAKTNAKNLDEEKGYSKTFWDVRTISSLVASVAVIHAVHLSQYLSQALASPFGQKVKSFYTTTSKQVVDIHEEARRIAAEQKKTEQGAASGAPAEAPVPPPTALA
ncbi:hypothetical protein EST38_g2999 [Candolleomyces aberdarensis]|uniref:RRM domain-containing protein n=1 Tax=Candolleomyces aberdarensis TaxID=2316362 RepID=A0A4Q2DVD3_9AGAR|nr:hypothetical protein EST38_g2999 [Candolleomyces aberdarensis]